LPRQPDCTHTHTHTHTKARVDAPRNDANGEVRAGVVSGPGRSGRRVPDEARRGQEPARREEDQGPGHRDGQNPARAPAGGGDPQQARAPSRGQMPRSLRHRRLHLHRDELLRRGHAGRPSEGEETHGLFPRVHRDGLVLTAGCGFKLHPRGEDTAQGHQDVKRAAHKGRCGEVRRLWDLQGDDGHGGHVVHVRGHAQLPESRAVPGRPLQLQVGHLGSGLPAV